MRSLFGLAYSSLINRKLTTALTIASITLSVALLIGVEKIRQGARESFSNTISQTDLIVGARTGSIQLLLYSVFHIGDAINNISYSSYLHFKHNSSTEWTIPYSLGDSHRGYRVVATDEDFYRHYHYRQDHGIVLDKGKIAEGVFDVVLGADVAKTLHYELGQKIVLSHGTAEGFGMSHADKPFTIVGIMTRTATPIDRSVYITLEGMEAIHMDWKDGLPPVAGRGISAALIKKEDIKIGNITAFLLRTQSRVQSLYLQREINEYNGEPLLAIMPGVALSELWQGVSFAENGLRLVTFFILLSGLFGMLISLYTSLNERRREMAILRGLGTSPLKILFLLMFESTLLTICGAFLGVVSVYLCLFIARPLIESSFGLYIPIRLLSATEWGYLALVFTGGFAIGLIPAWRAFRNTLSDGLTIRV